GVALARQRCLAARWQALAHRHDVPLAVLEPRGLRAASGRDAVLHLDPRHVVFLEHDASALERGHLCLDVVDLPERLAGFRRTRIGGRIHEDFGVAALVDYAAAVDLSGLESHGFLVEFSRALEETDRKSTRLNSSHVAISYAVFCLKKKKNKNNNNIF